MPHRQDDPRWTQPTEVLPAARGGSPARQGYAEPPADPETEPAWLPLLSRGPLDGGVAKHPAGPGGPGRPGGVHGPDGPEGGSPLKRLVGRAPGTAGLIAAAVLGVLVLAYVIDLASSAGDIPRGTVVAGVKVGGMSRASAETALRRVLEPRQGTPVPVRAGAVSTTLQPDTAGLKVNWTGTLAAAGGQPLNPFTRLGSLFGSTRTRAVVTMPDNGALVDALDAMVPLVHKDAVDAGVRFDGPIPREVEQASGQDLDTPGAAAAVRGAWWTGATIVLPVRSTEPTGNVTRDAVKKTIAEVADPAVSGDVTVVGEQGREALLTPSTLAGALTFAPDGNGGLNPVLDEPKLEDVLRPQLAATERPGQDAKVELVGGRPTVRPSADGHGVDYKATLAGMLDVLRRPAVGADPNARRITAIYGEQRPKVTTEQLDGLGIRDLVSSFSTGGFAKDSGANIKRAAEQVNGKVLRPGETFSLNDATGPREAAEGYVDAGIIQDGHPARGIGGGVSQLATTLYNAAYFAGMVDVSHREHSYYISRYPPAREATVYEGAIDLRFRNDLPTGIFIETVWTPSSITVRFWGTKRYEVTSQAGPRTDLVPPPTLTMPAGEKCTPSPGGQGFTATDTRTMKDLQTGRSTSSTHTVKYKPNPRIVCGGASAPTVPAADSTPAAPASPTPGG